MFKVFQDCKNISWIISQKKFIDFSPSYQRSGNIWDLKQKQLLIDSIINGFDIPKLYFHFMPQENENEEIYNYAIIDGKQRIETILEFIDDKFTLSKDFKLLENPNNKYFDISGKKFSEIDVLEPSVAARFLNYELLIVFIDTNNIELINEAFLRLNSGNTVNTAEKRNAIGGKLSREMKALYSKNIFFTQKLRMDNKRYGHFDLALKFLMLEMGSTDLGKKTVDRFVSEQKQFGGNCQCALQKVILKLGRLTDEFNDNDQLLSRKSLIVTLYSILDNIPNGRIKEFISFFENKRRMALALEDKNEADPKMIEFSRQLQQGADKKMSLESRYNIMREYLSIFLSE